MKISVLQPTPRSAPSAVTSTHYGAAILGAGSAIVSARRDPDDRVHVFEIERLPADLSPVVRRLRELEAADAEAHFHIGSMGSGRALWDTLHVDHRRTWHLFDKRGADRQTLVDGLLSAEAEDRLTLDPALREGAAMKKALAGMTREVREDGVIGGEMLVALGLALIPPPPRSVYEDRGLFSVGRPARW